MELKNLLTNLTPPKVPTKKYLAVEIGADSVKTAVWEIANHKPHIVSIGSTETTNTNDPDALLTSLDQSLSKACVNIEPEPNKVVFSFPENFVDQNNIIKEKRILLKQLTDKLELKPVGFVVTNEALLHHLKTVSSAVTSYILLGISEEDVAVSIVQSGRIINTHIVGRSDDIASDTQEGLARFGELDILPNTIYLYDGHLDLEALKQSLISCNLQEKLPFLHIPKIEVLSHDETIKAVVATAGQEFINTLENHSSAAATSDKTDDSHIDDSSHGDRANRAPTGDPETMPDLSQEFGFAITSPASTKADEVDTVSEISPEDDNLVEPKEDLEVPQSDDEEDLDSDDQPTTKSRFNLSRFLPRLPKRHSSPAVHFSTSGPKPPILLISGLVFLFILVGGAGAAYWYLPQATVTLYLEPKNLDRNVTFSIDPNTSVLDAETKTLPGKPVDTEVSGQATTKATGEKLVGDFAKGIVTIYNRTDSVKIFPKGTKIKGPDSLQYTLDADVSIASASTKENPDLTIVSQPSTKEVGVTATNIGAQFNLGKETEFLIANFDKSSFLGKAKEDITGGTSRQITAVSKDDLTKLKEQLTLELENKAKLEVNQSASDTLGVIVIPGQAQNFTEDYSAKVGQEADDVTLNASYQVKTITYQKSDLHTLIKTAVQDAIPMNYHLDSTQPDPVISQITVAENEAITVQADVTALILPTINPEDIAMQVRGKYPDVTTAYFKSLPGFARVEISIRPPLPPRLKTFPRILKNIEVIIKNKVNN